MKNVAAANPQSVLVVPLIKATSRFHRWTQRRSEKSFPRVEGMLLCRSSGHTANYGLTRAHASYIIKL
jgi:hypothetical protein